MSKEIKEKVRHKLIQEYSYIFTAGEINQPGLKEAIAEILNEITHREYSALSESDKRKLIGELLDEFIGYGPIEELLKDPEVSEIMINGPKKIYIERNGRKQLSAVTFDSEQQLVSLIYKILAPTRRHADESYPYTDVSLKDGSRVNIIIPPLALDGPTVTIRKFLKYIKTPDDLVRLGTLDKRMKDFLVACIKAKANIIFSGATGSGKTTTLNILSSCISNEERIVTIEDTAELQLTQDDVVRLEARQPSIEGRGEVTIRDLFKNSLRMRPQRIILGEIRGAEALDMLQAICSGHRGSLAVLHASSPQEVIYRLESMILTSGLPISLGVIHRQISAALNLIVQQEQLSDGVRRITHITQVNGLKEGQIVLEDLFRFDIEGIGPIGNIEGSWHSTGATPAFENLFRNSGISLPPGLFKKD